MAFRFKPSEPPGKAVKRVCRECVDLALARLGKPHHPAAIHAVRKEIKKLRAVFWLVRKETGRRANDKINKALREAAGHLAAPRDARVMLKAFEKLDSRAGRSYGGIQAVLEKHSRYSAHQFRENDSVARAKKLLRKTRKRAGRLKITLSGWAVLEPRLKECHRRGQKACQRAHREADPEALHEWRKQVKQLWYYYRLLDPVRNEATQAMTADLKTLGEQLGDEHDLFLLQQFVAAHDTGAAEEKTVVLVELIGKRRKALRSAALKLGARLYAGPPKGLKTSRPT